MRKVEIKIRLKELLIDYIVISIYLLSLLAVNVLIIRLFNMNTHYSELTSQIIATVTSVFPIILIFAHLDYRKGSIGKQMAGLIVHYHHHTKTASLLRNIIKFLPWQISHIGVIHGIYNNFDTLSLIIIWTGLILGIIMLCMGLFSKSGRHLGDYLAGTQVVEIKKNK